MATKAKKSVLAEIIISLVFGLIFGGLILLISNLLDATDIIKWCLIIAGVIIAVTNIAPLIRGIVHITEKGGVLDVIFSALGIVLGVLLAIFNIGVLGDVITVLLAVYLIAFPIIRIIIAPSKKEQLSKEWIRILIGAILIVFMPFIFGALNTIVDLVLTIVGIVIIVLTVLSFVLSLIAYIKASKKTEDAPVEVEAEATEEAAE